MLFPLNSFGGFGNQHLPFLRFLLARTWSDPTTSGWRKCGTTCEGRLPSEMAIAAMGTLWLSSPKLAEKRSLWNFLGTKDKWGFDLKELLASWKLHRSGSLSLLSASSLFEFWPWQWSKDEIVGIWPSNSCYSRDHYHFGDLWSSFEGNPWYIARHFIPLDTFWCLHLCTCHDFLLHLRWIDLQIQKEKRAWA